MNPDRVEAFEVFLLSGPHLDIDVEALAEPAIAQGMTGSSGIGGLTEEQKAIEAGFAEQAERFKEEGSVIYRQV